MTKDDGRPGGLSPCGPSPAVSTVPASIPDAVRDASETIAKEFARLGRENERLREYLSTFYVNALRTTRETAPRFASFIMFACAGNIPEGGDYIGKVVMAFDAAQKCSTCGAFSPVLGNGQCQACAPEWPRSAQAIDARRAEPGTGSVHESAVRQDAPKDSQEDHHG